MNDKNLFKPVPRQALAQCSKEELITFIEAQGRFIGDCRARIEKLEGLAEQLKQQSLLVDSQYIVLKNKLFGKSSEKEPRVPSEPSGNENSKKPKKTRVQLPSQRYPNAPLIERHVELQELPSCDCCGLHMKDTGMTEDSEFLTVVPAQYIVVRQLRHKYGCEKCHGDIKTAPAPKRVIPGGVLDDAMVIDVSLSKYCDLIPIERYASIAGRSGLEDLPPHSLIDATHRLADFVSKVYLRIKNEILCARVLHADETPHRMLEGDDKSRWYLWGFSSTTASYYEARDTRSGDVASELLERSKCEYLMSDVFCGYAKAVRDANERRRQAGLTLIQNIYCNAHSRRYFKRAKDGFREDAQFFLDLYGKIYHLEAEARGKSAQEILDIRALMRPLFEVMRKRALDTLLQYPSKSAIAKAIKYFLDNYDEFTLFLSIPDLPIDNNPQERLLRNPVVGRKTWYGTHSKDGALTMAILFTLVESCKLNGINPRVYVKTLVADLHAGKEPYTPHEFKQRQTPH